MLTDLMKEYEVLQLEASELQKKSDLVAEKIKHEVFILQKTQKFGNVIATYSKGRGAYDYETMASNIDLSNIDIRNYQKVTTDWKKLCDTHAVGIIKENYYSPGTPFVNVKLETI